MAAHASLDASQKQKVEYCIPMWLRDEQIKLAIARVKERIESRSPEDVRSEPVALVCFGPSLNDTWEKIRDFRYIITCSGAHRFLLDRGIVPTWDVEVDPRAHKALLIGPPHADVTYLIASTCHQKVFDHLEGYRVVLWHIFDSKEDGFRTLPHGEWALTGGCSAGLRTMTVARFLGFTDLHIFGMDGSFGASGQHAAAHPNQSKGFADCEYDGVTYQTTPSLLEAARQTWHELNQMPDVRPTFYGGGLVQAMAKNWKRETSANSMIAFTKPELISAEYRDLNAKLHRENLAYGVGGGKHAPTVLKLLQNQKLRSVLDYGCGKGYLGKALAEQGIPIWEWDPAIQGKDEAPRPADLCVCTDVLEHIEPEKILYVLDDLRRCVKQVGYFVIHTGPSSKKLADGRNTHLLQRDRAWWERMLGKFFHVGIVKEQGPLLYVVVGPTVKKKAHPAIAPQPAEAHA